MDERLGNALRSRSRTALITENKHMGPIGDLKVECGYYYRSGYNDISPYDVI